MTDTLIPWVGDPTEQTGCTFAPVVGAAECGGTPILHVLTLIENTDGSRACLIVCSRHIAVGMSQAAEQHAWRDDCAGALSWHDGGLHD